MTKLDAVNYMMRAAGQWPSPALDSTATPPAYPTAYGASLMAHAEKILDIEIQTVLGDNWNFNSYSNVTITADGSGNLATPASIIEFGVDPEQVDKARNVGDLGGAVYDYDNNTFVFGVGETVVVKYNVSMTWNLIPDKVQRYAAAVASEAFNRAYGQPNRQQAILMDVTKRKVAAKNADSRAKNVNLLDTPASRALKGDRFRFDQVTARPTWP